mgnify:CR=1 FL=1
MSGCKECVREAGDCTEPWVSDMNAAKLSFFVASVLIGFSLIAELTDHREVSQLALVPGALAGFVSLFMFLKGLDGISTSPQWRTDTH